MVLLGYNVFPISLAELKNSEKKCSCRVKDVFLFSWGFSFDFAFPFMVSGAPMVEPAQKEDSRCTVPHHTFFGRWPKC
jgi:hypothetical protein